jgi:arylsulfatase A-like enzyme
MPDTTFTRIPRGLLLIGALLPLALACGGAGPPPGSPNVVVISLDTLRADHLGCYGYARQTSPSIDAFAASATRYTVALSSAPWTLPSHASLFTGKDPFEHGAHTFPDATSCTVSTSTPARRST